MTSTDEPAAIYRHEAARLRTLADQRAYRIVRENMLEIARQYDLMAEQADGIRHHSFGRPFGRRPNDRAR
jgi:hypothetical protein